MSGYLDFKRTGHKEVDDIIWEIEQAGDSYHHTSQWDESSKLSDGTIEPSWIDNTELRPR